MRNLDHLFPERQQRLSEEQRQELSKKFRATFLSTTDGIDVLAHLCKAASVFDQQAEQSDMVLSNFVKAILIYCGIWRPDDPQEMIRQLHRIEPVKEQGASND